MPICKLLLENGAKHDTVDETGRVALHWAIRQNFAEVVTLLIGSGSDVNAMSDNGKLKMCDGVKRGHWLLIVAYPEQLIVYSY